MRLVQVHVQNFKLLEDVTLNFSVDPKKPLTVVRAENGSGKTSILYALIWAFYGTRGLADQQGQDLRLTSTAVPVDREVQVQVQVTFENTDEGGVTSRYQLIRTVSETPGQGDKVDRGEDRLQLYRATDAGHENVPEGLLKKLIPERLQHVFFTNGDDVQKFISGKLSNQRQKQVHETIKALLGLDTLRTAVEDLDASYQGIRRKTAKESGADLEEAEAALAGTQAEIGEAETELEKIQKRRDAQQQQRDDDNKALGEIRGVGDIDDLNEQILEFETDLQNAQLQRATNIDSMVELFQSEAASWCFLSEQLIKGVELLDELRDRNVIPGTSIQVLVDRLELGQCICGEPIGHGTDKRQKIEKLLEDQQAVDENRQRLSRLSYLAGSSLAEHEKRVDESKTFEHDRDGLRKSFTAIADTIKGKDASLTDLRNRRAQINETRVQTLAERIDGLDKKIAASMQAFGAQAAKVEGLKAVEAEREQTYEKAKAKAKVTQRRLIEQNVSEDLLALARGTLQTLETDYVQRVSERMEALFLEIVGSDPTSDGAVFTGASISENYDIVIESQNGRTLDPDFELNGASQRALTLCFIWAVMQVADVTAPRIIDTPLGMVAGGVKTRMVDAICRPSESSDPDFQVVLLLTRSEIRDVEDLLDDRAGLSQTLSCSKDYPVDLINDWDRTEPVVLACECGHRDSCDICARRYDDQHGIKRRSTV